LIKSKTRLVKDTQPGETFTVFSAAMRVTKDGSCYLWAEARLLDGGHLPPVSMSVERREDGFHVKATPKHGWEPDDNLRSEDDWIPVTSITVLEEPNGQ
jgi:hypothetical protein